MGPEADKVFGRSLAEVEVVLEQEEAYPAHRTQCCTVDYIRPEAEEAAYTAAAGQEEVDHSRDLGVGEGSNRSDWEGRAAAMVVERVH